MPDLSLSALRDATHQAEQFPEWIGWLVVIGIGLVVLVKACQTRR